MRHIPENVMQWIKIIPHWVIMGLALIGVSFIVKGYYRIERDHDLLAEHAMNISRNKDQLDHQAEELRELKTIAQELRLTSARLAIIIEERMRK